MSQAFKTIHAAKIYYIKQGYKLMCKELHLKSACKDKDFLWNCSSCWQGRVLRDYGNLIDDLEDFYKWEEKNKALRGGK